MRVLLVCLVSLIATFAGCTADEPSQELESDEVPVAPAPAPAEPQDQAMNETEPLEPVGEDVAMLDFGRCRTSHVGIAIEYRDAARLVPANFEPVGIHGESDGATAVLNVRAFQCSPANVGVISITVQPMEGAPALEDGSNEFIIQTIHRNETFMDYWADQLKNQAREGMVIAATPFVFSNTDVRACETSALIFTEPLETEVRDFDDRGVRLFGPGGYVDVKWESAQVVTVVGEGHIRVPGIALTESVGSGEAGQFEGVRAVFTDY